MRELVASLIRKSYDTLAHVAPTEANKLRSLIYRGVHKIKGRRYGIPSVLHREHPSLLVDVTQTEALDVGTGIQRVVRSLLAEMPPLYCDVLPVHEAGGKLLLRDASHTVTVFPNDTLLLLDSSWAYQHEFQKIISDVHANGGKVYAVIYDLFPILYPRLFDSRWFNDTFREWHNMVLQNTDGIICISRATADVVSAYYEKMKFEREMPLEVYWFHMGADIPAGNHFARQVIRDFVSKGKTFLMVGTVEPRKGYLTVIKALRKLLSDKDVKDIYLLVFGHDGWKNDELHREMFSEEMKDNILWIDDATDEELHWAYANTSALIAASKDEGFGLPLIEAAYFGLPIICSDIPIFREVTQGHADYFKVMDADSLAECLSVWLHTETHPDSRKIHIYTWEESAREILDIIDGKTEPYKVLG